MANRLETSYRPLLDAIAYAARAHRHQLRKDGETPYVSHAFRVCLVVRDQFGVADPRVLTAAVLHDTVEDTNTDFDDLEEIFGREVAGWVATLSKDKRLPDGPREEAYCKALANAAWQVQVCKLADILDNLFDSSNLPAPKQARTLQNARRYLDALRSDLKEQASGPWQMVARWYDEIKGT